MFYCVFYCVLLCVLLCFAEVIPWDTKYMRKNSLPVKYWKERAMGRLLQTLKCCCFDRRTKINLREFSDRRVRNLSIQLCSFIASLIKTLTFHCTLYFVQNGWSRRLKKNRWHKKKRHKIPLYATRARPNLYVFRIFYFQRFISSVYSCYVFYISVAQKLSVDLRPRDLEGFKGF